jgi:hypothetical protein
VSQDQQSFRAGDLAAGTRGAARGGGQDGGKAQLDEGAFPVLAGLLRKPAAEFRAELDALSAAAKTQSKPAVQQALQTAVQILNELYRNKE